MKYQDWTARKEFYSENINLRIYLEPKPSESIAVEEYREKLALELSRLSYEFGGLNEILGFTPLQISLLKPGSFDAYMKQKQQEGADLAHIKPPHMQPSNQVMKRLLEFESSLPGTL